MFPIIKDLPLTEPYVTKTKKPTSKVHCEWKVAIMAVATAATNIADPFFEVNFLISATHYYIYCLSQTVCERMSVCA